MNGERISKEPKNILILCVDRDDDVGVKTGIPTPLIGREAVYNAAMQLIVKDPEEADANTMFESLRVLNALRSMAGDERYEVAAVAGSPLGEMEADRKIAKEVQEALESSSSEAVILISDGYIDQMVSPIIQSYAPIISVRRFAVKHSEALETSWFILSRYLKTLLNDPKYSKWTLGIPGIMMLMLTVFYALSFFYPTIPFATYAGVVVFVVLGLVLVVKGFGVDKAVSFMVSEVSARPSVLISAFGTIAGIVVCALGVQRAFSMVSSTVPKEYITDLMSFLTHINIVSAAFIDGAIDYIMVGVSVILVGRALYYFFIRNEKMWPNSLGVVAALLVGETLRRATGILREIPVNVLEPSTINFFLWVGFGILLMVLSILIVHRLRIRFSSYFRKPGQVEA